jgi:hypothetical protein
VREKWEEKVRRIVGDRERKGKDRGAKERKRRKRERGKEG